MCAPRVSVWTARVRNAVPLIYRPQITRARESAWFLLAAVTSNTSFVEPGAATLAWISRFPRGHCLLRRIHSLNSTFFAKTARIIPFSSKRAVEEIRAISRWSVHVAPIVFVDAIEIVEIIVGRFWTLRLVWNRLIIDITARVFNMSFH